MAIRRGHFAPLKQHLVYGRLTRAINRLLKFGGEPR
jgi:hypothetical protein